MALLAPIAVMTCGSVGLDVEMFANLFDDQEPATSPLERDLAALAPLGYTPTSVQPVDMFPQTADVECCCALKSSS